MKRSSFMSLLTVLIAFTVMLCPALAGAQVMLEQRTVAEPMEGEMPVSTRLYCELPDTLALASPEIIAWESDISLPNAVPEGYELTSITLQAQWNDDALAAAEAEWLATAPASALDESGVLTEAWLLSDLPMDTFDTLSFRYEQGDDALFVQAKRLEATRVPFRGAIYSGDYVTLDNGMIGMIHGGSKVHQVLAIKPETIVLLDDDAAVVLLYEAFSHTLTHDELQSILGSM